MGFERIWHKRYPAGVPAQLDYIDLTMPEFLTRSAQRFPAQPALDYFGKKISYAELDRIVNRFARALMALGVEKGDTVAMLLPNIPQIVIADYAAWRIGAVTAMNNPLYTERELAYQLDLSDAKVLVTMDLLHSRAMNLMKTTPLEKVVVCHVNDYLPFPKKQLFPRVKKEMYRKIPRQPDTYEFLDIVQGHDGAPLENQAELDAVGVHLYTGGTTGTSKGAMITHRNMSYNTQQLRSWLVDIKDGEERELAVFPFFHAAGFTGVQNMCVLSGWTDVLVPRPEPATIVEVLKKSRPTLVPGVPTIYVGLLADERFTRMDLSFIKGFLAGAAPLPLEIIQRLEKLTDGTMVNVYGLTEMTPMATASPWKGLSKPGTVGLPLPDTDMKIVDLEEGTRPLGPGEAGEVCFKGPQIMAGYYKRPEETANTIRDGWLYTGDIGVMDEDGFLTIVDRKKDMIVASGYNVYPNEIDDILFSHPKILEACTVGVPDPYRGETVRAYVVVKPGEALTAEEVVAFCKEKMAAYKVPRQVEFIDALPKSAVGKILRKELRRLGAEPES
ncbi:MAG TPA: long-chain fatty acid--CoA ligase [Desulfobacteraceae bacterium]|nr:long-chain fatty acid--CoA ligase [Deltaproteobacteria bacterium]HDI59868.1 long-chain fatty acid--CoA ligase [Desulfobacteraceae bacterium]